MSPPDAERVSGKIRICNRSLVRSHCHGVYDLLERFSFLEGALYGLVVGGLSFRGFLALFGRKSVLLLPTFSRALVAASMTA